ATAAISGLRRLAIRSAGEKKSSMNTPGYCRSTICLMSAPAANALLDPVSTTQPIFRSFSNWSSAWFSSSSTWVFRAFSAWGRFRVIRPTRSRVSIRRVSKLMALLQQKEAGLWGPAYQTLLQGDGGVDRSGLFIIIKPARGNGLGLGVEQDDLLAVRTQVAQLGAARATEGEQRYRHRNRHVDPDLTHIDVFLEAAGNATGAGEDGGAVAVRVGVDDLDGIVQRVGFHHAEHRPEDLGVVHAHAGLDASQDGRADEVAIGVTGHLRVATVQHQLGPFIDALLDQAIDALQR